MPIELDEQFFRKLDRFEVVPHGVHRGGQIGPRRSPSRGTGLEFADHKEYSAGDDIRYIDWNVYAHLEELFVKVFEQEETLPVYVLLDVSDSMSVGSPSKLELAAKLAAALSYVALANQDAARVILFANGLVRSTKVLRGKARIYDILQLLDAKAEGTTSLSAAIEAFSAETHLPGVALILSDFLDPEGVLAGARLLAGRRFAVHALHLVDPSEQHPAISGDVEIQDVETGKRIQLPLRRDTLERFAAFFEDHCTALRDELSRYGVRYLRMSTAMDVDEILFARFPKEGVLR